MKKLFLSLLLTSALFANELTIKSDDGFILHGWLNKPTTTKQSSPIILFAHQFGSDHTIWNDLAKKFNAKGYATLSIDLRGHGKSILQNDKENKVVIASSFEHIKEALIQSDKKISFENIPLDLTAWLEHISEDESLDIENLYLFGSSLGAGTMIPILNEYEAKGLVAISAGKLEKLSEDIDMALAGSMTKTLFIASKNDPLNANKTAIKYTNQSILGTSLIISGEGHGTVILPKVEHFIFSFMNNIK
ncbi:MAG: hypothetical protein HN901_04995 [Campylobacteraceae bacterium]|jgi:pimeloyl-ACP methyl ester carboxylesterase|nr:hypothetical protein [Campylobacteraceae bacterium]